MIITIITGDGEFEQDFTHLSLQETERLENALSGKYTKEEFAAILCKALSPLVKSNSNDSNYDQRIKAIKKKGEIGRQERKEILGKAKDLLEEISEE